MFQPACRSPKRPCRQHGFFVRRAGMAKKVSGTVYLSFGLPCGRMVISRPSFFVAVVVQMAKKVSGTVFWNSWPSLGASGDFEAQFLRGGSGPRFVSERGAAIDAAAECCEFCIGLRRIDMVQPAG